MNIRGALTTSGGKTALRDSAFEKHLPQQQENHTATIPGLPAALMDASLDPVFLTDFSGTILCANKACETLFGYKPETIAGKNLCALFAIENGTTFHDFLARCDKIGGGSVYGEHLKIKLKAGETLRMIASITECDCNDMPLKIIVMKNISEELRLHQEKTEIEHHYTEMLFAQAHYESQASHVVDIAEQLACEKEEVEASKRVIEHHACHDPMTGLGNRILMDKTFFDFLTRAKSCCGTVGFIYIDLDEFKKVNDSFGHKAGDKVLCDAAEAIRGSIKEHDVAIRLGGDEFGIIIYLDEENESAAISETAQKLLDSLRFNVREEEEESETVTVTASIGIAHYPQHGHTLDMLLNAADQAMYKAKKSGKAKIC